MANKLSNESFGLIETLIATGILTMVAASVVVLNARVVRNTALLADRLVAFEWAQEGLEIVRQIRDTNLIDGNPLTDWQCFNPPSCTIHPNPGKTYHPEVSGDGSRWILAEHNPANPERNRFDPPNQYARDIRVLATTPPDNEKRLIRVTVSFQFGGRTERVTLATIVTNWKRET